MSNPQRPQLIVTLERLIMTNLIELRDIYKTYRLENIAVPVLKGIDLTIARGDYVSIMGTSGSGKSTLMNIIGCLDRPTSGEYWLEASNLATFSEDALAYIRNQRIGFVFQQFNLLSRATALTNVMLPMVYANIPLADRKARAIQALTRVGLSDRLNNRPNQLSGGQQQRVAIARALANNPALILADEPTGALDSQTSQEVMDLLADLNHQGTTIIIVTHEPDIAAQTRRIIMLKDGLVVEEKIQNEFLSPIVH
jgi:putative ABC transport system ATP-binding protein